MICLANFGFVPILLFTAASALIEQKGKNIADDAVSLMQVGQWQPPTKTTRTYIKPTTTTGTTTTVTTTTRSFTTESFYTLTTTTGTSVTKTSKTTSTSTITKTTKTRITASSGTSTTGTTTTITTTSRTGTGFSFTTKSSTTATSTTITTSTRSKWPKPTTTTTGTSGTTTTVTTQTTTTPETTTTTSVPCTCPGGGKVAMNVMTGMACADMQYTGFVFGGKPASCAVMARFCNDPSYVADMKIACPSTCCSYSFAHSQKGTQAISQQANVNQHSAKQQSQQVNVSENVDQYSAKPPSPPLSTSQCQDSKDVPCMLLVHQCNSSQFGVRLAKDCPFSCGVCKQ